MNNFEITPAPETITANISLGKAGMAELMKRFEESKAEYPNLTWDAFISWAVKFYLQHAYAPREED